MLTDNGRVKRAVLLNDTSSAAHHGSRYVVAAIRTQLSLRNICVVASAVVGSDWEHDPAILAALKSADLIVVNGEGTLHHGAVAGRRLLQVLEHPLRGSTPVVFINMLWQENPAEWERLLSGANLVAVRDTRSQRDLAAKGIKSIFCPDLSFAHAWPVKSPQQAELCVAFGDSIYPTITVELRKAYTEHAGPKMYLPIRALRRHESTSRHLSFGQKFDNARHEIRGFLRSRVDANYVTVRDTPQYLSKLSEARFHVTGRYHAVCLSVVAGVPFVAVASNSHKIEALIDDIGLDRKRIARSAADAIGVGVHEFSEVEIANIENWNMFAEQRTTELFDEIRTCSLGDRTRKV